MAQTPQSYTGTSLLSQVFGGGNSLNQQLDEDEKERRRKALQAARSPGGTGPGAPSLLGQVFGSQAY